MGKGTQASLLAERLGPCHLSTGDIFRAAKSLDPCERTPALLTAYEAMLRGELVTDAVVLDLVGERAGCLRCLGGFLLDGFPRTLTQAHALDALLDGQGMTLDAALSYALPLEKVVARLGGRQVCGTCQATFHPEGRPSAVAWVCDRCGGRLGRREDDRPDAVKVRLEAYERETAPVIEHYRRKGLLRLVSADGSPEEVYTRSLAVLG